MTITEPNITGRRTVKIMRTGTVEWTVCEFDYGGSYLLTSRGSDGQFQAHFNREGWRAFQALVATSGEEGP